MRKSVEPFQGFRILENRIYAMTSWDYGEVLVFPPRHAYDIMYSFIWRTMSDARLVHFSQIGKIIRDHTMIVFQSESGTPEIVPLIVSSFGHSLTCPKQTCREKRGKLSGRTDTEEVHDWIMTPVLTRLVRNPSRRLRENAIEKRKNRHLEDSDTLKRNWRWNEIEDELKFDQTEVVQSSKLMVDRENDRHRSTTASTKTMLSIWPPLDELKVSSVSGLLFGDRGTSFSLRFIRAPCTRFVMCPKCT